MLITFLLVMVAGLALVVFVFWARGDKPVVAEDTDVSSLLCPVDLEALRNLIDEDEERFLRANLSDAEFRWVQRQRLRAAVDYVTSLSQNAAILLHVGLAARHSADPEISEAGRHLVDNAARLRIQSLIAKGKLYSRIVLPELGVETTKIVGRYEQMRECAALLARLRSPASGGLVSRTL
jgi:hypothetical protein